jgi:hypothetical protein
MKKRYGVTLADIERWRSVGLGLGTREQYRPWLSIRDVSSCGRKSRSWGITTGHVHHLLSDNERHFFQTADFDRASSISVNSFRCFLKPCFST